MLKHLLNENFGTADVVEFFNKYHKHDAQTAYELMNNPDKASQMDQQSYKRVMDWLKNNQQHLDGSVMKAYDKALNESITEDADVNKLAVKPITRDMSKKFVEKHYLGKFPAVPQDYIGIFYTNPVPQKPSPQMELPLEELVGVIIYGSPTSPLIVPSVVRPMTAQEAMKVGKQEGDFPFVMQQVKELQRMYIKPLPEEIRKNLATMSIVRANKLIESKYPNAKLIVSYSDSAEHAGTIYKASNAIYLGRGKASQLFKFFNSDRMIRPARVKPEERDMGELVATSPKDKYVWLTGDNRNKKYISQFLKMKD